MGGRAWLVLAVVVLAGLGLGGWWYFRSLKRPFERGAPDKIRVVQVLASDSYFREDRLFVRGRIRLSRPLPGEGVVEIEKAHLVGMLEGQVRVPITLVDSSDRQHLFFSAQVPARDYIRLIRKLQRQDSVQVTLQGKVPLRLPVLGRYDLPLDGVRLKLATLRLPIATLGHLRFTRLGLKYAQAELPVYLQNRGRHYLRATGMTLKVSIGEVGSFDARQLTPMEIHGMGRDTVTLRGELRLERPLRTGLAVLQNKDRYRARIEGRIALRMVTDRGTEVRLPFRYDEQTSVELMPSKETISKVKKAVEAR